MCDALGRLSCLAAAHLLRQAGARRGRPIAAITASSEALAILAYAAPLLGTPLFPIDPALPGTVIDELIGQVGDCLIVGDGQTVVDGNHPCRRMRRRRQLGFPEMAPPC